MGRSPCCSKVGLNRGAWTAVEDQILTDYIKNHGEGKWRNLPKKAGLKRCGKSCRLRWLNYLRPDIKRGNITRDEEELIVRLHKLLGNRWSLIAGRLPGRTDNEIKNYWNTNIGKKVQGHRPSSTSNPNPSNHSIEMQNVTIQPSVGRPRSPNTESCVVRTKASRCTKVFITTSEPQETEKLDTKPVVGPSTVQNLVDDKAMGPESLSPLISRASDFMMDFDIDDCFLSDFLNVDFFLQPYDCDNGVKEESNTSTSNISQSLPNSNIHTLLFTEEMSHASVLDSEMDWLRD